ncbi:MAG: PEP-CTERM sorting domain-containing protein, partial [Proteobacteria bacterium]|nr:PEP-CTERM sorting domain-containing protein [Pseudomonadota bacterium]
TSATIRADDFVLAGSASMVDNTLRVETPTPWRLEGSLRSSGGRSHVEGSPFHVGSATGPALLDAAEPLIIDSDVVLEATATVEAELGISGSAGRIAFNGRTTLQGAAFNPATGPWTPGGGLPQPHRIRFAGDVATEADTTVVAGSLGLNDRFTPAAQRITIDPARTLAFDARSLSTSPLTSLDIGAGATFDVVIRDPTAPTWTNEMTITLGGGGATLRSTPFVHEGQLLGSGTIDGSFTGPGFVAPGLSPGLLHVTGDVELGPGATLAFEIGGADPEDYDRLRVDGDLSVLGGVFQLSFLDGFTPTAGDRFDLFQVGGHLTLDFVQVDLPVLGGGLAVDFDSFLQGGPLVFTPEPGTAALFLLGLGALACRRRGDRRRT